MGCTIVGSSVNAIAQIMFSEGMAEIVIAVMATPIATLVNPTTMVITAIVVVVSPVVIPATVMATVSTLRVV